MDNGMAVRAASTHHLLRGGGRWRNIIATVERGRMIGFTMALLAQERLSHLQHTELVGAVRIVAIGAVFTHRLMLPQEWAAFFRMALITGLRNRVLDQLFRSR